jgi:hypothetical protein
MSIRKLFSFIQKATFVVFELKLYPWVKKCFTTIDHVIHVLLYSKFNPTLKKVKVDSTRKCYILGNGPSLKDNLKNNLDFLSSCSLIVVNDMSQSEYFEILKPEFYVLADPGYWDSHIHEELKDSSNKVLKAILEKTSWPMNLIIPWEAYKNENCRNSFVSNKNITLVYYNSTAFNCYEFLNRFVYKHYLGMPKPQNVLIPCIYMSINFGFKEINLLGVDHSWIQFLYTNDENKVCLTDSHFYDKEKSPPVPIRTGYGDFYKMHQILTYFSLMFEGYHVMKRYADFREVKIFNRTVNSFIDAFDRKNIID